MTIHWLCDFSIQQIVWIYRTGKQGSKRTPLYQYCLPALPNSTNIGLQWREMEASALPLNSPRHIESFEPKKLLAKVCTAPSSQLPWSHRTFDRLKFGFRKKSPKEKMQSRGTQLVNEIVIHKKKHKLHQTTKTKKTSSVVALLSNPLIHRKDSIHPVTLYYTSLVDTFFKENVPINTYGSYTKTFKAF